MATEITFETTLASGKFDTKGREIGFTVKFGENGGKVYAWVQKAIRVDQYEFKDWGATQRGKGFDTQEAATRWAYATAKQRIASLA